MHALPKVPLGQALSHLKQEGSCICVNNAGPWNVIMQLGREEAGVCTHSDATDNETSVTIVQYPSLVYTTLQGNNTVVLVLYSE